MENIVTSLVTQANESPDRLLLDAPDGVMPYGSFFRRALSLAERIAGYGLQRGDRVAILAKDYTSCMSSVFGCWLSGTVAVPINMSLSDDVKTDLLRTARVRLKLVQGGEDNLAPEIPAIKYVELPSRTFTKDPLVSMQSTDLAMILFTSGTTGTNKGVCLTLGALSYNALLAGTALKLSDSDRIFVNTPPYYTSGLSHFLTMLTVGGSVVARNGFYFGEAILDLMERAECNGFGGAPTHLMRMIDTVPQGKMPSEVRFWISSGDHLPPNTIKKAQKRFPHLEIFTVYGLTEVGGRLCVLDPGELPHKAGSVGKPVAGMRITVRNKEGNQAPAFEVGEVFVEGPLLMKGYLQDSIDGLKEFATGDYGYFDKEGFLWLKGRKDDVFKSGGEKVSCVQIQENILSTGMVFDAVVLATRDKFLGKVPYAYVVPTARYNEGVLMKHLKSVLTGPQIPKKVVLVDAIPRTGSGKVRMAELRSEIQQPEATL